MYKRLYETVAIVDPESGSDGVDKVLERMRDAIERTEGKETRTEDWGRRTLAYEMRKQRKGQYLYLQYVGTPSTVPEVERLLGITEEAMKYQTIVLNDRVIEAEFDYAAAAEERTGMERSAQQAAQEVEAALAAVEAATAGDERLPGKDEEDDDA